MALENYHLVWLDPSSTNFRSTLSRFQQLIHSISHCSNLDEFYQLVQSFVDVKIIVIVSNSFDDSVLSQFDSINSIYSVYRLSNRKSTTKKLQGTFEHIESIYEFVRRDLRQIDHDNQSFKIVRSDPIDPIYSSTMLLRDLLLQKPSNDETRRIFFEFVRREFLNNSVQLTLIDEYAASVDFPNVAVQWFTRPCFLSALLHRALKNKDADLLDQVAFFIGELHRQIEDLHRKSTTDEQLVVYFGQNIDKESLDKLQMHPNSFLIFDTFLMTTIDRDLSEFYAQQSAERTQKIPALFQINIDRTKSSFPFVRLNALDFHCDTDQYVLFSLNPTFRLDSIQLLENQLYLITISLIDPIVRLDSKVQRFFPFVKTLIDGKNFSEALTFCQIELKQTPTGDFRHLAELHHHLAQIYQRIGQYVNVLDHLQRSLNIRLESFSTNDRSIAPEYFAVATMLKKLGRTEEALESYQKAIQFGLKSSAKDAKMIATYYLDLGKTFLRSDQKTQANLAFQSAQRFAEKSSQTSSDPQFLQEIQQYIRKTS